MDQELPIWLYLRILARGWWVLLVVLVITVGVVYWLTWRSPEEFETRARLLIVPRITQGVSVEGLPNIYQTLSPDTLSNLATANDLVHGIINDLDLRDKASGDLVSVQSLAGSLSAHLERVGLGQEASSATALPVITMKVRGTDPGKIKRIADKWAELFVKQNGDLFTSVSAASFQFLQDQYDETMTILTDLELEKRQYMERNPLPIFEELYSIQQANLVEAEQRLASTTQDLSLLKATLQQILLEIEGLSIGDQWGGLALDPTSEEIVLVSEETLAQRSLNRSKIQLFSIQKEIIAFRNENGLAILDDQLVHTKDLLITIREELAVAENDIGISKARAAALESLLEQQPQFLILAKAAGNDALFGLLGLDPDAADLERVKELLLLTQELNPVHMTLASELATEKAKLATVGAKVPILSDMVVVTEARVKVLEKEQFEKAVFQLSLLENQLAISSELYQGELKHFVDLNIEAVDLRVAVEKLEATENVNQDLVEVYSPQAEKALARIDQTVLGLKQLDRQIGAHSVALDDLWVKLQQANIAKEEQLSSIRVVEKPIIPTVSIGPRRTQSMLLGTFLGLALGALAAFGYQFLRMSATSGIPKVPHARGRG